MGWSSGTNYEGRTIGYAHRATCEHPDCKEKIDLGLSYCCGDLGGVGGERGCGHYFCGEHMLYGPWDGQRCEGCGKQIEDEATRMAIAVEFGVSEWETFVSLAERKLLEDGALGAAA